MRENDPFSVHKLEQSCLPHTYANTAARRQRHVAHTPCWQTNNKLKLKQAARHTHTQVDRPEEATREQQRITMKRFCLVMNTHQLHLWTTPTRLGYAQDTPPHPPGGWPLLLSAVGQKLWQKNKLDAIILCVTWSQSTRKQPKECKA